MRPRLGGFCLHNGGRWMNTARIVIPALAAIVALGAEAEVSVSRIFSSHMVLQRDRTVPVWGSAKPGDVISVSFAGQEASAKADANGDWQVMLKPLEASCSGSDLVVKGPDNAITNTDVLVGDVWLCSGQSNMEMSFGWGIYDGDKFKKESVSYPQIRHVKISKTTKPGPELYKVPIDSAWDVASNAFNGVTATGYFFARKLVQELDVPIGLVNSSWSGCRIEPFIAAGGFRAVPALKSFADQLEVVNPASEKGRAYLADIIATNRRWADEADAALKEGRMPTSQPPMLPIPNGMAGQYNSMISPLTRFPIKGAIWYQGCSNGSDGDEYADKTEGLVLGWREAWGYDFPFYWVQLASYTAATSDPAGGNGYARIRDAQRKALRIPNTGMAVAIDVGNPGDIHPKAKLFVGERLALWALAKDYGKDVVCSGPLFKSLSVEEAGLDSDTPAVRIKFEYTGSGLMIGKKAWNDNSPVVEDAETALKGFSICGIDGKWYWAKAEISGTDVVVSSPDVPEPVAVRYAFRANPLDGCNLYNKEGLPASPFSEKIEKE